MISITRILVPIDFSEHSRTALKYALAIAERFGSSVQVLHVIDPPPSEVLISYAALSEVRASAHRDAEFRLQQLQHECSGLNVSVASMVIEGCPLSAIIQQAKDGNADLIVLGTHGRRSVSHMLLGSVAEKTVRSAPCPVLTVRHIIPVGNSSEVNS